MTPEIRPASDVSRELARYDADTIQEATHFHTKPCYDPECEHGIDLIRIEADRARIAVLEARLGKHTTDTPCPACSQPSKDAATIAKQAEEIVRLKSQLANCQASSEEIRATAKERTR